LWLTQCCLCATCCHRELKVVTGEWFLEERSKRFQHVNAPTSDVIKQSILSSPPGEINSEFVSTLTSINQCPDILPYILHNFCPALISSLTMTSFPLQALFNDFKTGIVTCFSVYTIDILYYDCLCPGEQQH